MSNSPKIEARRTFLRLTGLTLAVGVVSSKLFKSSSHAQGAKPAAKPLEMVKPTDSQAQALGYYEDVAKVDVKKFPKRAGPEGAKQYCYNCQFYVTGAADPKTLPQAPCTIFANKGVKSKAWCNSWVQNPKVKG